MASCCFEYDFIDEKAKYSCSCVDFEDLVLACCARFKVASTEFKRNDTETVTKVVGHLLLQFLNGTSVK